MKLSQAFGGKVSRHVRGQNGWFSYPELMDYRAGTRTLDGIAGIDEEQVAWETATNVRAIGAALVTGDYFTALRATPARGRLLTQSDAERPVAVVSHRFWRQSLNGDNEVVGGQLVLDRTAYTVVGVADASFAGTNAVPADDLAPAGVRHPGPRRERQPGRTRFQLATDRGAARPELDNRAGACPKRKSLPPDLTTLAPSSTG